MTKSDILRKLTSRKFWLAVAAFVSGLIAAFGGTESVAGEVSGLIMSGATVLGYLLAEGLTDAYTAKATTAPTGILVGEIVSTESLNDTQKNE